MLTQTMRPDVMVNVTFVEVRMNGSRCEVEQRIDNEYAYKRASPSHRTRCKGRPPRPPAFISDGPALLADSGQLKSSDDVQDHSEDKYCAGGPQQTRLRF